jgi:hypothetical protein
MGKHWGICCSVSVTRQRLVVSPATARRCAIRVLYDAQTSRLRQSCASGDVLQTQKIELLHAVPRVCCRINYSITRDINILLFWQLLLSVMKYVYGLHPSNFICLYVTVVNICTNSWTQHFPVLCICVSYDAETSQTQSHITTGGQSVLVSNPIWNPRPDFCYCQTSCGFVDVERSLWPEDGSVVSCHQNQ